MSTYAHIPLQFERRRPEEMLARARAMREELARRRSIRFFSDEAIPDGVLDECIGAAGTAPSGANMQPWTFAVVREPGLKHEIRVAAEEEERESYGRRMTEEWLAALAPLGTDEHKPFLDVAPALIVVFRQVRGSEEEDRRQHYYTQESVGIACGMLLAALHNAGLATLTHTPSPMGFLERILERPENERAYLLIPVGYPADDCTVPDITKKTLDEIRLEY